MFQNRNNKLENIVIRQFKRNDLSSVQEIFLNGYNQYKDGPTGVLYDKFIAEKLTGEMCDIQASYLNVDCGNFWVAEDISLTSSSSTKELASRIVGIAGILPRALKDEISPVADEGKNTTKNKVFELKRMYVGEDYHGTGVAQLLLEEVEKFAFEKHNCLKVILSTGYEMTRACKFYEKQGYKRTHTETVNFKERRGIDSDYKFQKFEKSSLL